MFDKLKEQWNENPMAVAIVGAAAVTAAAKLIDAFSSIRGRRTWAKEVNRRIQNG
jgi:hypothetical protein